jgi:hypothetical protein
MVRSNKFLFIALTCLVGVGASLALAEPKPAAPAHKHGEHGAVCEGCAKRCPMHALSELADAKVDNTKAGATVTFTAKKAEDAQKVQELAQKLAKVTGGSCCGGGGGGGDSCGKADCCKGGECTGEKCDHECKHAGKGHECNHGK